MTLLFLGLAVFFLPHFATMARGSRAALIGRFGEGGYKGAYSALSLLGVALIAWGFAQYRGGGLDPLYAPPAFGRHLGSGLLLVAFILVAAANMPAGYIKRTVQHPFLAGVALWAIAHLLMNGDRGGLVLFGAFLAYVVIDAFAVVSRGAPAMAAPDWRHDARAAVGGIVVLILFVAVIHPYVFRIPLAM